MQCHVVLTQTHNVCVSLLLCLNSLVVMTSPDQEVRYERAYKDVANHLKCSTNVRIQRSQTNPLRAQTRPTLRRARTVLEGTGVLRRVR